jgi:hypothetical protein
MINGVFKITDGFGFLKGDINSKRESGGTSWGIRGKLPIAWDFHSYGEGVDKVVWVAPLETFIWNEEDA